MRMRSFFFALFVLVVTVITMVSALSPTQNVQALGNYIHVIPAGNGTCTNKTFSAPVEVQYNVPASGGIKATINTQFNGKTVFTRTTQTGFNGHATDISEQTPYVVYTVTPPYTYAVTMDYFLNGTIFSHVIIAVYCDKFGVAHLSTTNRDKNTSTSLFPNVKINEDTPDAPIVAYCNGDHGIVAYLQDGTRAYTATETQIKVALLDAIISKKNVVIEAGNKQQLWALKSGQLKFSTIDDANQDYVFAANRCD